MNMAFHNGLEMYLNLTKISLRLGLDLDFKKIKNPVILNVLFKKRTKKNMCLN